MEIVSYETIFNTRQTKNMNNVCHQYINLERNHNVSTLIAT